MRKAVRGKKKGDFGRRKLSCQICVVEPPDTLRALSALAVVAGGRRQKQNAAAVAQLADDGSSR